MPETFNYTLKIETVAIAAFNCNGELLFGQRLDTGRWTMPGGHLEAGEAPLEAAQRELREETGLSCLSMEFLGTEEVQSGIFVHAFTAIVDGIPTGEHDPDNECDVWEFIDASHGLPQGLLNNLQHPKNVVLRLLGLLDPYLTPADPDDIDAMMAHCDPMERSMALKMDGILPRHLISAFNAEDPAMHAQALGHPAMSVEVLAHLMRLDGRHDVQQAALDHKLCNQVQIVRLLNNLKEQVRKDPNNGPAITLMGHLFNGYEFDDQTVNNTAIDESMPMKLRALLYRNPNINNDLLQSALDDPEANEEIRLAAIKNHKVPTEYLVHLLKNPNETNAVAMAAAMSPRLTDTDLDQLVFHSDLRGYHPQIKQFALMNPHIQARHIDHIKNLSYKAVDTSPSFDQQLNKFFAKNCEEEILADLLGVDARLDNLMAAAKFLCNHEPVLDIRTALFQNDGDLPAAVLAAYGMPITDENKKALAAIRELKQLAKSELPNFFDQEVTAGTPDAAMTALRLQDAFKSGSYESIDLKGKHIANAILVRCKDGDILLKPNSDKGSPALGIDEETASQAQREAAFYHVAKAWDLDSYVPVTNLVYIMDQEYAAIQMFGSDYTNLDIKRRKDVGAVQQTMFPYVNSGTIWLWAALDFVTANSDRHANNVLVNHKDEIKLIDHGSAFASLSFAPGLDENTFIPYYLRYQCVSGFNKLSQTDKLKIMPRTSKTIAAEIKNWLLALDLNSLQETLNRYQIDPTPSVARLAALQLLSQSMPIDEALASLWCGTISLDFE